MKWSSEEKAKFMRKIVLACEVTNTQFSDEAKTFIRRTLEELPAADVMNALDRCIREVHGRMSLADILDRVEEASDGRESERMLESTQRFLSEQDRVSAEIDRQKAAGFRPPRLTFGAPSEVARSDEELN